MAETRRTNWTQGEVIAVLRQQCDEAGSLRAWARAHRVSAAYVSDVLAGHRHPGKSILGPLGITVVVRVERTYTYHTAPRKRLASGSVPHG